MVECLVFVTVLIAVIVGGSNAMRTLARAHADRSEHTLERLRAPQPQ